MIEFLSDDGRFRAVVAQVEVVLWRSVGTFGRADNRGRMWKRLERSVFDQPIDVVREHVTVWLKTLG
jgi:hypothetical protein